MDAKSTLRRYLEQRQEMGERELILETITSVEAAALIASAGTNSEAGAESSDWRAVLAKPTGQPRAASAAPPPQKVIENAFLASVKAPSDSQEEVPAAFVPGIIIGSSETELFSGEMGKLMSLEMIAEVVRACTRCPLFESATNAVPGEGNPNADLICVGEAPGDKEDLSGRPFVGRSGELLTKILDAIGLAREEVFILNVLKHRPPMNRNPRPEEVEACSPYLIRQINLIKPKVIVAFGTFAAQTLLQTKTPIGKLRGMVHRYHGTPLVVTYHPAALLRNPAWKRPTWEDVKLARRILDSAPNA